MSIWSSFSSMLFAAAVVVGCDSSEPPTPVDDDPPSVDPPSSTGTIEAPGVQRVRVVNTAAEPLPTQTVGTTTVAGSVAASQAGGWNVSVAGGTVGATQAGNWSVAASQSGTWGVTASQDGPWAVDVGSLPPVALAPGASVAVSSLPPVTLAGTTSVSINGTPTVAISGTPTVAVAAGAVTVDNTEDSPVPVRMVEQSTRTPWVGGGQILIGPGQTFESEQFYTPTTAGHYLVIESFTIQAAVPDGQTATYATILGSADGVGRMFTFPLERGPEPGGTFDSFHVVGTATINVTGGAVVSVSRDGTTGTALANVAMSGYIVKR